MWWGPWAASLRYFRLSPKVQHDLPGAQCITTLNKVILSKCVSNFAQHEPKNNWPLQSVAEWFHQHCNVQQPKIQDSLLQWPRIKLESGMTNPELLKIKMFIWIHTSHPRPTSSMAEISRCWTEADSSGCFAGEASRSSCIGHREEGKKGQRKVKDWNERAWHKIRVLHIGIHCWSHRPMVCKPRAEVHPSHPPTQLPKFDPLTKTLWKMHWTNQTIKMDYFEIGWSNIKIFNDFNVPMTPCF